MESTAQAGDPRRCGVLVASQVVPGAEDWLPRVSGHPAWATSLETEHQTHLELSEEQRLQVDVGGCGVVVGAESLRSHWQQLSPWLPTDF